MRPVKIINPYEVKEDIKTWTYRNIIDWKARRQKGGHPENILRRDEES